MLPTIDFNNIDELIDYIDEFIITNHNNEIIAVQHNNIENGLSKFIIQAPRNWNTAKTIGAAGNYVAAEGECFLIFRVAAVGSITLIDNKWNEWIIVNRTLSNKQLIGSISAYRTASNTIKNYISPLSAVSIAKGDDGLWYETSNTANSSTSVTQSTRVIQFTYGSPDSLSLDGRTFSITDPNASSGRVKVHLSGYLTAEQQQYVPYQQTTSTVFNPGRIDVTINNQDLQDGQVVTVEYPITENVSPVAQDQRFYATLNDAETKTLLNVNNNIFLITTNTSNKVEITLSCISDSSEDYMQIWVGKVSSIGGLILVEDGSSEVLGINPFGEDFFFGNVVISGDNSYQGVAITVTGIANKTIKCVAEINYKSFDM